MTNDLWLSLVELDPRHRATRVALGDACARYRIVMAAFPGAPSRQHAGALYTFHPPAAEQPPRLLVQSTTKPDWSHRHDYRTRSAPQVQDIRPFWDEVIAGDRYLFRLTASPCHGVGGHGGNRVRGTRTPIRDPTAQVSWLTRLLTDAAELAHVHVTAPLKTIGRRGDRTVTLTSVTFSGDLTVTDPHRLREQALTGIGPGKAFGNGLLTLANAPTTHGATRKDDRLACPNVPSC